MDYFSDREKGPAPLINEDISHPVWCGIYTVIDTLISTGAFWEHFPMMCPDGARIVGTDPVAMGNSIRAEIPTIGWPLTTVFRSHDGFCPREEEYAPNTLTILDLIQFCYMHVATPIQDDYHDFFKHYHLRFSHDGAKNHFREKINRIFARNGVTYELNVDGTIVRLAPPVLLEGLASAVFRSGDDLLDRLLDDARGKFLNPDSAVRRDALEKLWDAWERLKSLDAPNNKKDSVRLLLDKAAPEPKFRALLENEAIQLNSIGNDFHIRHFEANRTEIQDSSQVDYLFHRMFSMVWLLLKARA